MPKPSKTHGLFDPCGHQFAPPIGQKGICPECGHCDACAKIRTEGIDIEKVAKMAYDLATTDLPDGTAAIPFFAVKGYWEKLARSVIVAIKEATNA